MRCLLLLLAGVLSAGAASGQPVGLAGPVESYTFDSPTSSLRAIMGFPGAAFFGPALVDGLDFASVAPHLDFAIAFRGGECLLVTRLSSSQAVVAPLSGISGRPEAIAWSGDGSSAVLYSRAGSWIQTISGLPLSPAAHDRVDLSYLGGSLASVAADALGQQVAVAISGDTPIRSVRPRRAPFGAGRISTARHNGAVYLAIGGQAFNSVLEIGNPVALAFSQDAKSLLVVDAAANELTVLNLGTFQRTTLALDGLADPFAVRPVLSADGRQMAYVASRSDRLLREYDLTTRQQVASLSLSFVPTGIDEFGRDSFLVASRAKAAEPAWLLTSRPQMAVYFVPAVQGGQE